LNVYIQKTRAIRLSSYGTMYQANIKLQKTRRLIVSKMAKNSPKTSPEILPKNHVSRP
jgi:hypothetical protein